MTELQVNYEEMVEANKVLDEIRNENNLPKDFPLHAISVGVWIDGKLVFHGVDGFKPKQDNVPRMLLKNHACSILLLMKEVGEFDMGRL